MIKYQFNVNSSLYGKGKGVKIAHIDSGINQWHPHIGEIAGGLSFNVDDNGAIYMDPNYHDVLGHGTAVAGVMKEQVPEAELWAIKIFHDRLTTYIEVLCVAIEWCIDNKVDIINLSLGVNKDIDIFRKICQKAAEAGIIIVTSCDEKNSLLWPGYYSFVFGVKAFETGNNAAIEFDPNGTVKFQASSIPRSLEGPIQKFNLDGHSFAAAHVSSFLAKIKEKHPDNIGVKEIQQLLCQLELG